MAKDYKLYEDVGSHDAARPKKNPAKTKTTMKNPDKENDYFSKLLFIYFIIKTIYNINLSGFYVPIHLSVCFLCIM